MNLPFETGTLREYMALQYSTATGPVFYPKKHSKQTYRSQQRAAKKRKLNYLKTRKKFVK